MKPVTCKNLVHALLFLLLLLPTPASFAEPPMRVVSINLCSDQLLLLLAHPEQIASVSRLSLEPNSSYMAGKAARYPVNDAKLEQLLLLEPDLILAEGFTSPSFIRLLKHFGLRVEIVPNSFDLEGIRRNIRLVAGLLGNQAKGENLISEMDLRIQQIADRLPPARPKAVFYQPRGYTSGRDTLQDTALSHAGWRNLSRELGVNGYGNIELESLLAAGPDRLFTSAYAPGTHSVAQRRLSHPALNRITGGRPMIEIPYRYWICGGPMIADAIEILADSRPPYP
jgi:iron complex transport system substrate-binding protein